MKATYCNRYKDNITFEHKGKTVTMSGYSPYYRIGWPNKYDVAYTKYLVSAYLDAKLEKNQMLTQEEFEKVLHVTKDEDSYESNALYKLFGKYIYSDTDTIDMIDPSGGPYLTVGMNLKIFFGTDYQDLIIESIKVGKNNTKFKIK